MIFYENVGVELLGDIMGAQKYDYPSTHLASNGNGLHAFGMETRKQIKQMMEERRKKHSITTNNLIKGT